MLGDFIADKNRLLKLADLHPSKKSEIFPITIGLKSENTIRPCGSGLARESGVPVYKSVTDTPLSRASPLPQW
ncbi:hypothetical protein GDV60_02250 [Pseudomonas sp. DTU12.1]|nr:hypothetical protein GDV60_02250 [Pseudomonas sp. DTU12.1]